MYEVFTSYKHKTKYRSRHTVDSDLRIYLSELASKIDKLCSKNNQIRPIDVGSFVQ